MLTSRRGDRATASRASRGHPALALPLTGPVTENRRALCRNTSPAIIPATATRSQNSRTPSAGRRTPSHPAQDRRFRSSSRIGSSRGPRRPRFRPAHGGAPYARAPYARAPVRRGTGPPGRTGLGRSAISRRRSPAVCACSAAVTRSSSSSFLPGLRRSSRATGPPRGHGRCPKFVSGRSGSSRSPSLPSCRRLLARAGRPRPERRLRPRCRRRPPGPRRFPAGCA